MKKIYFLLMAVAMTNLSFAQKTTGVVNLGTVTPMSVQLDLDNVLSLVTMTFSGPSDTWFAVGFNVADMYEPGDYVIADTATTLGNYSSPEGHEAPFLDATNGWTIVSNTVSGATRTIVATRSLAGAPGDFAFDYATIVDLPLIAAHGTPGSFLLDDHDINYDYGMASGVFTALGVTSFNLEAISIYPNPSNGVFTISKDDSIEISKATIFDSNAKLLKVLDAKTVNQNGSVNLSELSTGVYFMELSNGTDKVVKKVIIKK